ncbi:MAG: DUF6220 domain-containing protein [Candidatus Limnocylindria bacterium]
MVGTMRLVYAAAAWLFVGAVVVQVFLAGLGLFAGAENFELHAFFGFTVVHLISLLLVILGALGRVGRRNIWLAVLLFVLIGVQVSLPGLRADLPLVAAIHPANALLIFWLGLHIALRARRVIGAPSVEAKQMPAEPMPTAP